MSGKPLSIWRWSIAAAGASALAAGLAWHEHREAQRFNELNQHIEAALRAAPSRAGGNVGLRIGAALPDDALAELVAQRVLAIIGPAKACAGPPDATEAEPREPEPREPEPRTREQMVLLSQATDLVDRSIRNGRLTRADVLTLRRTFAQLGGGAEQAELRGQVVRAINTQKLVPEDPAFVLF